METETESPRIKKCSHCGEYPERAFTNGENMYSCMSTHCEKYNQWSVESDWQVLHTPPGEVFHIGINPFLADSSPMPPAAARGNFSVTEEIKYKDKLLDLYGKLIRLHAEVDEVKKEINKLTNEA